MNLFAKYFQKINIKDLNECATGNHNCASGMRCENYPGSFRCIREISCGTGYSVNATHKSVMVKFYKKLNTQRENKANKLELKRR